MPNQYPYSEGNSMIMTDGNIIWNDQSHDQSSLQYMDANDTIINNTSIDESGVSQTDTNETQYFSILEHSNDVTLEDLHSLTMGNVDSQENVFITGAEMVVPGESNQECNETDETQVVVFTIDGSDELYGMQFSQDEEGNIQKYQFKFRTSSEGQLEAIPETVQLLLNDEISALVSENKQTHIEPSEDKDLQSTQQYFFVQTQESLNLNQSTNHDHQHIDTVQIDEQLSREHVFIKDERHSPVEFDQRSPSEYSNQKSHKHAKQRLSMENVKHECVEQSSQLENNNVHTYPKKDHYKQFIGNQQENGELHDNTEQIEQPYLCIKQQPQSDEETSSSQEGFANNLEITEHTIHDTIYHEDIVEGAESELNSEDMVQQVLQDNSQIEVEYEVESEQLERSPDNYKMYRIQNENNYLEEPALNTNNESDSEQYEVFDGLHITGEIEEELTEEIVDHNVEPVFHEVFERHQQTVEKTNILKHPLGESKGPSPKKPFVSVKYYVVYPEKENVNSLIDSPSLIPVSKSSKPNPRSVLRTSFMKPKEPVKTEKTSMDSLPECDFFEKRFSKNKEAMRAKLFHHFLNRTTIPHAPVRQQRQPRKQEIKPVTERSDEEIIVQEVIVSSSGFIENLNKKLNKKLQVTAVVELSDSEEESSVRLDKHNQKSSGTSAQAKKPELNVIEINSDDEANSADAVRRSKGQLKKVDKNIPSEVGTKRRRGRPPKKTKLSPLKEASIDLKLPSRTSDNVNSEDCSPDLNLISSEIDINIEKKEIACPKCPKTFPSQNSLNTHIIHHNLENSLKNKSNMNSRMSSIPRQIEYNHKCDTCHQTFKNNILLQRHNCSQKDTLTNKINCSVCLKQFRDLATLNIHKKIHIKSNLISSTNITKISPKKSIIRASTSSLKSPKPKCMNKVAINTFKCNQCSKVCESEQSLVAHTKLHRKFICSSCSATFSSRILLDNHVRISCVKTKSPINKRMSFKIKKSFVHTPPKRLSICKQGDKNLNNTMNQSLWVTKLECDKCQIKFSTFRSLYTHKVQQHGLDTPDKSLLTKPKQSLYKPKAAHGGIPANAKMKKAYAALRQTLAEMHSDINTEH